MYRAIEIGLAVPSTGPGAPRAIEAAVNALAIIDEIYLLENPQTPPLAKSGVRYQREVRAWGEPERWQSIAEILASGVADCEDLAAARIAELRIRKIPARPKVVPAGRAVNGRWHIIVEIPTKKGAIRMDPSRELGMK